MSNDPQLPLQVQAVINRLQARLGSSLADAAASLMAVAEEAPGKLNQEWQLFWQEVELEAQRLEQDGADTAATSPAATSPTTSSSDPQELIDGLRARVAALSHRLDA